MPFVVDVVINGWTSIVHGSQDRRRPRPRWTELEMWYYTRLQSDEHLSACCNDITHSTTRVRSPIRVFSSTSVAMNAGRETMTTMHRPD